MHDMDRILRDIQAEVILTSGVIDQLKLDERLLIPVAFVPRTRTH